MADLESALGYVFRDDSLLRLALTHRSFEAESPQDLSNERLEFLGDAVLGLVVAAELYESWDLPEGSMAKVRAAVVDETALATVARSIGLGEHVLLGKGEEASGGRDKSSILADAMEALLGAAFLDGGLSAARELIIDLWSPLIDERVESPGLRDYKTRLQEALARRGLVPSYEVVGSGPDHDREFSAVVEADGDRLGTGAGRSKKRAEQAAARAALESLDAPNA